MLTRLQRQPSLCITDPQARQAYRTHMCGLCHSLGDGYGLFSRLLTTREMILLNLLTTAQRRERPDIVVRRCPLNPLRKVTTNRDGASAFAAATSVELATLSFADDMQDSGGQDVPAQVAGWLLRKPHRLALRVLAGLGFETKALTSLTRLQAQAEQDGKADPARPSARISASLFVKTAQLARNPQNEAALIAIGANYGAYIYLADAYRDFPHDMARGDFNPLRRYSNDADGEVMLSAEGLAWLLRRFQEIQSNIQRHMAQLHLYRYRDMVTRLLCEPVDNIVQDLSQRVQQGRRATFHQWTLADALKAAFFIFPATEAGSGLTAAFSDHMSGPNKVGHRDKRKGFGWCYAGDCCYGCSSVDCADCGDSDCGGGDGCDGCDCGSVDCSPG